MGLGKWLLKNGFGSPGSTAKTFAKQYHTISKIDHDSEWEEIFSILYIQRVQASARMGNLGGNLFAIVEMKDIINASEGDLTLFVFEMMFLETIQFRKSILKSKDTFMLATEVIYDAILDNAPATIKLKKNEFRSRALDFALNFDE